MLVCNIVFVLINPSNYIIVFCSLPGNAASSSSSSSGHDKMTLKRVLDFVTDKTDDDMRDMNRKLQTMLEEALTKNMHLQQVRYSTGALTSR